MLLITGFMGRQGAHGDCFNGRKRYEKKIQGSIRFQLIIWLLRIHFFPARRHGSSLWGGCVGRHLTHCHAGRQRWNKSCQKAVENVNLSQCTFAFYTCYVLNSPRRKTIQQFIWYFNINFLSQMTFDSLYRTCNRELLSSRKVWLSTLSWPRAWSVKFSEKLKIW